MCRFPRPVATTFATSAALLLGAGSAAFLPIASEGCPSAVTSVLAEPAEAVSTTAPSPDAAQTAADTAAVAAAQEVVDAAAAKNDAAQLALSDAEGSVPTSAYSSLGVSYQVSSAQSAVETAQSEVNSAQSWLATDQALRDTFGSSDDSYDDQVADDQDRLDLALRELADAKSTLAAVEGARSVIGSASAAAEQTSAELATAQSALDAVRATVRQHQAVYDADYAEWKVREDVAQATAQRDDRDRVVCRQHGRNRLIVSGVVAVVGGALCSYSFVQRL